MTVEERLATIAKDLRRGESSPRVTVRELLSWFDAQRRGFWIVERVRAALAEEGLVTEPDFESAYIDSHVEVLLAKYAQSEHPPEEGDMVQPTAVPDATATEVHKFSESDPTYRISKLEAANKSVVSVAPTAALQEALTLMLSNGYSQIPVMPNERDVKGMVTWSSIAQRLALCGRAPSGAVQDFMDPHQEIRAEESIFMAIAIVSQHDYVLVRAKDRRITGVVTASDLNSQFQLLAEPFLLLAEIENSVRRVIETKFEKEELQAAKNPADTERQVHSVADLTFGEYIRLLSDAERWTKLAWAFDRSTFIAKLDRIRAIRNDVMHFDPDGVPKDDLDALRDFARFLQRAHSLGIC